MIIEPFIDWLWVLPAEMKAAMGIAVLILVFAYTSLRPGDPTI
jgi:hypothetical protein